jgi:hypothetical protein
MVEVKAWYVVQQATGQCIILSEQEQQAEAQTDQKQWGPFSSKGEAIARRVGLIRAGKCQPT